MPNPQLGSDPVLVEYVYIYHTVQLNKMAYGPSSYLHEDGSQTYYGDNKTQVTFPGPVQIAEYRDGKLFTSDMHITALEFCSFYQHPDSEWSIEGIERYVTDLRKRVAERERAGG
ncbi:hypothetical protein [Aeoliella mucimassa]|uniref:hypothetical protein n=1 Tax=Aeoliella mucimassa TaxID=2527972 RepID=UPI0018D4847A|nr:hypothetical protein [Aeoliella mucimassa]